jgi:hypothetical protein
VALHELAAYLFWDAEDASAAEVGAEHLDGHSNSPPGTDPGHTKGISGESVSSFRKAAGGSQGVTAGGRWVYDAGAKLDQG